MDNILTPEEQRRIGAIKDLLEEFNNPTDNEKCNHCKLEDRQKGAHCYGGEPVFCVDSGECERAQVKYMESLLEYIQSTAPEDIMFVLGIADRLTAQLVAVQAEKDSAIATINKIRKVDSGNMSRADDLRQYVYGVARVIWEWQQLSIVTAPSGAEGEKHE